MEELRVLQILDKLSFNSGVSSIIMNYYDHIDKRKIIFDFLVHEDTPDYFIDSLKNNGSRIYQMPELKAKNLFIYIKSLNKFFKEHDEYKIVHGHIANAAIFYLGIAKQYKVPVRIIHSHNSKGADNLLKRFRNHILNMPIRRLANYYFACSDKAAVFLYGEKFLKNNNIYIMNNAINIEKYAFNNDIRIKIREKMNIDDKTVIGHVGRFCSQKNHSFLIDIFYEVHKYNPNTVLMLVGEGELENKIKKKVRQLQLENYVFFMGMRNNVNELMQAMDIFVLPSLFEGLPVVGIEAQVAGLPCIFSSSITRQADVSEDVLFFELDDGAEFWKDEIVKLIGTKRYVDNAEKIKTRGYDILEQCNVLATYYNTLLEHKK